jgi:hypothetical protein
MSTICDADRGWAVDEWLLKAEDSPPPHRDGLELVERLLWAGAVQIRAGRANGVDPRLLNEWRTLWMRLLDRYERACQGEALDGRRRAADRGVQLSLLPLPTVA